MLRWLNEAALVRIEPPERGGDPAPAGAGHGVLPWQAALAAAAPSLAAATGRSAWVRFIVSDHFVRYLVLPWDAALRSAAERAAYLRHHFESVYGPRTADWSFAPDGGGEGATRVAAAMDRALVDALGDAAARASLALASIEPLAVSAFNRLRRSLPAPGCFFVVRESGRLTSLLVQDGAPRRVASQRSVGAPQAALAGLLAAEAVESGIAPEADLAVCVAEWPHEAPAPVLARRTALRELLLDASPQGALA